MLLKPTYLPLLSLHRSLDTIATFDHVSLEAYGPRSAVKFEEQAAGITEDGAEFIPAPERCCRGAAVLADWL